MTIAKTPIADMVATMLSTGIPPETIVAAVRAAEQHAQSLVVSDPVATKRRAFDRERKRRKAAEQPPANTNSTGIPPETMLSTGIPPEPTKEKSPHTPLKEKPADDADAAGWRIRAQKLTDQVHQIFGFDPQFIPPAWYGSQRWFEMGLRGGWDAELVLIAANKVAARRRARGREPPDNYRYLERPIRDEHLADKPQTFTRKDQANGDRDQREFGLFGVIGGGQPHRGGFASYAVRAAARAAGYVRPGD